MKENVPKLSLCMIVKNEEEFLAQCLDSVKDLVDEMIIVDTGSTDATVQIAESYHAQVYHHAWQGSFSEARNYGLQFATGDWILQLDADEALEREDIPVLKEIIKSDKYNAVNVALLSDTENGWAKHYFQRIFRRGKAHFEGIVHNQLKFEGNCLNSEIRVYHWGYNLSDDKMDAKYDRTEKLLLKQIEVDPTNAFAHHNYLRVLRVRKRWEDAVQEGKKALHVCEGYMGEHHRQMITYDTAHCLLVVGRVEEAEKLCRDILEKYPKNLDLLYTMASIYACQKQYDKAVSELHRFIEVKAEESAKPQNKGLIVDTYSFAHKVWEDISTCYFELGDIQKAEEAARQAVSIRPQNLVYRVTLAQALIQLGKTEEAVKLIQNTERECETGPDFFIRWSELCKRFSEIGKPEEPLKRGLKLHPESDELYNSLAYVLQDDNPSEAEKMWKRALEINPDHVGSHAGLARHYARAGEIDGLNHHADAILQKAKHREILRRVGGFCLNAKNYAKAIELLSHYLEIDPENVEVFTDVATCYAKMGQYEAAMMGYQGALQLDPTNEKIIKNIQIMKRLMVTHSSENPQ